MALLRPGSGAGTAWQSSNGKANPNGMFQVFGPVISTADVTDGTTNTIALGEWRTGDNDNSKCNKQYN